MRKFDCCFMLIWLALPSWAGTARMGKITSEMSDVYECSSFKCAVIEKLRRGTLVRISEQKIVGKTGLGVFYKIQTPTGKYGFLTDSDVEVVEVATPPAVEAQPATHEKRSVRQPSSWGLSVGMIEYSEKFFATTRTGSQSLFGLRRTGGASKHNSWRTDASLSLAPGAPTFLSSAGAYGKTTGYILIGDFLFLIPVFASETYMIYVEPGPALIHVNYSTNYANDAYSSNATRFGGNLDIGASWNHQQWAIRADVKIHVEKTIYASETVGVQLGL